MEDTPLRLIQKLGDRVSERAYGTQKVHIAAVEGPPESLINRRVSAIWWGWITGMCRNSHQHNLIVPTAIPRTFKRFFAVRDAVLHLSQVQLTIMDLPRTKS